MNVVFKILRLILTRGLGAFSAILITYIVTNNFDVRSSGSILYAISIIGILSQLLPLGCEMLFMRITASNFDNRKREISRFFSSISILLFIIFFFIITLAVIISFFYTPEIFRLDYGFFVLPTVMLAGCCAAYMQLVSRGFIGLQRQEVGAFYQSVICPVIFTTLIFFLINFAKFSATSVILFYSQVYFICSIICYFHWKRSSELKFYPKILFKEAEKTSIFNFARITVITVVIQHSTAVLVAFYLIPAEIASYNVSRRLSLIVSFLLVAVNLILAPKFAQSYKSRNFVKLRSLVKSASIALYIFGFSTFLVFLFFGSFILGLFGEEYIKDYDILLILIAGQTFNIITGSVMFLLSMTGHEKDILKISLFNAPVSVALTVILSSQFGLIGAAISTSVIIVIQNLCFLLMVKRRLGFNTLNPF